ncbi:hypothetical protein BSKO_10634 [Bryopsis sp. KO-2023]|nr:hypothetical protein BSKO_10634 [Bryopsis sp. KO-2023]
MLHRFWLTFHEESLEKRFQVEFDDWGVIVDKLILIFTVFLRIAILTKLWLAEVDTQAFYATLVVSIPVLLEFLGRKYFEKHSPELLKDWRTTLVCASRYYMSVFFGRCIPYWLDVAARHPTATLGPWYPALFHFASSGIPLRFALAFGLPLKFSHHLPLQLFTAISTTILTKKHYCGFIAAPKMEKATAAIFTGCDFVSEFAWDAEDATEASQLSGDRDYIGPCSCVRLLVFTNLFWGVCIASYLWWNVEFRMRINFLRKHGLDNNAELTGLVKVMSLFPWIIATFALPVFAILWRGTGSIANTIGAFGIVEEASWFE